MSEIPDWLVELAAQQDVEEDDELEESEWDFLRAEPAAESFAESSIAESSRLAPAVLSQTFTPDDDADDDASDDAMAGDLMAELRSQVENEEPDDLPLTRPTKSALDFRVAGLQPWQQLVLSVLVLLDVSVIGLLVLVMLGRITIP